MKTRKDISEVENKGKLMYQVEYRGQLLMCYEHCVAIGNTAYDNAKAARLAVDAELGEPEFKIKTRAMSHMKNFNGWKVTINDENVYKFHNILDKSEAVEKAKERYRDERVNIEHAQKQEIEDTVQIKIKDIDCNIFARLDIDGSYKAGIHNDLTFDDEGGFRSHFVEIESGATSEITSEESHELPDATIDNDTWNWNYSLDEALVDYANKSNNARYIKESIARACYLLHYLEGRDFVDLSECYDIPLNIIKKIVVMYRNTVEGFLRRERRHHVRHNIVLMSESNYKQHKALIERINLMRDCLQKSDDTQALAKFNAYFADGLLSKSQQMIQKTESYEITEETKRQKQIG